MSPFTISPASSDDYDAFVTLFAELEVPERAPSPQAFTDTILPDALFLREGERVAGYVWARARGEQLHVVHVVTGHGFRQKGVGRALMRAAAARGRARGLSRWMLNVKPENHAARALYARCGLRVTSS